MCFAFSIFLHTRAYTSNDVLSCAGEALSELVLAVVMKWLQCARTSAIESLPEVHLRFSSAEASMRAVIALLHAHAPLATLLQQRLEDDVDERISWNEILRDCVRQLFEECAPEGISRLVDHEPLFEDVIRYAKKQTKKQQQQTNKLTPKHHLIRVQQLYFVCVSLVRRCYPF